MWENQLRANLLTVLSDLQMLQKSKSTAKTDGDLNLVQQRTHLEYFTKAVRVFINVLISGFQNLMRTLFVSYLKLDAFVPNLTMYQP